MLICASPHTAAPKYQPLGWRKRCDCQVDSAGTILVTTHLFQNADFAGNSLGRSGVCPTQAHPSRRPVANVSQCYWGMPQLHRYGLTSTSRRSAHVFASSSATTFASSAVENSSDRAKECVPCLPLRLCQTIWPVGAYPSNLLISHRVRLPGTLSYSAITASSMIFRVLASNAEAISLYLPLCSFT